MAKRNKDKWSQLSMQQRADLIKLYTENGIYSLPEMKKDYNGTPYRDFHSSEYDYFNAHSSNAPLEEEAHWTSRNPITGQILKREDHPTFDLAVKGEEDAGYQIVRNVDGNLYSIPKQTNNYVEKSNSFETGGWKDTALLGASFVPYVGTGIDIYNLIKDPSWENAGWAALSLGSDVLGLTALKGLAKSAKLAKGVKAAKALEQAKTTEKYVEAVKKGMQLEHTGNPKKIALAAGRRGQAYYDNLVATRQLRDATIQAENLAAKSKILDNIDKSIDFYGNVINEKDALKELLYANGGRILDGTEEQQTLSGELLGVVVTPNGNYVRYSSKNENVSLEDYTNARIEEDRIKAVSNILNQENPLVPKVPALAVRPLIKAGIVSEEFATKYLRKAKNPHTCIYTATGMYPKGSQVAGNKTFEEHYSDYGFQKVNDMQVGDMLQLLNNNGSPYHAVIVTGFSKDGKPLLSYANGGIDTDDNNNGVIDEEEKHMRYNQNNLYTDNDDNTPDFGVENEDEFNIFRYVGNLEQKNRYRSEYFNMFK